MEDTDDTFSLFLNSKDSNGANNYTLRWLLPDARVTHMRGFDISLQKVYTTNTVYPINQYNNQLYVWYTALDVAPTILTIPPNNYDGYQLAEILKTIMEGGTAEGHTFKIVYDAQSKKLTFECISLAGQVWAFGDGAHSLNRAIGVGTVDTFYNTFVPVVSDYPVDLSGTRMITVISNLGTRNYHSSTTSTVLDEIPVGVGFGSVITYEAQTDDVYFVSTAQFQQIELSLRDDRDNPWELPDNQQIIFTFKVTPLHVYSDTRGHKRYRTPQISYY